jgi:hypothetical protein
MAIPMPNAVTLQVYSLPARCENRRTEGQLGRFSVGHHGRCRRNAPTDGQVIYVRTERRQCEMKLGVCVKETGLAPICTSQTDKRYRIAVDNSPFHHESAVEGDFAPGMRRPRNFGPNSMLVPPKFLAISAQVSRSLARRLGVSCLDLPKRESHHFVESHHGRHDGFVLPKGQGIRS